MPTPTHRPDLDAVDELARLVLVAKRLGCQVTIVAPDEVADLVAFAGLDDVLEVCRQSEVLEQ